ncbi:hypothetical protein [uncultured Campylobacter sp.]|uniref:hypothetical protein n=1 Tax=uncultured Campylobacter sp. TaxID=218934 RepID=UPI0028EC854C|nr:hypothetical protein [uncultured Campylobacter sp.]
MNNSICGDYAFAVSQVLPNAEFYPFKFIALICGILHRTINFIFYRSAKALNYEILLQHGILKFLVQIKF